MDCSALLPLSVVSRFALFVLAGAPLTVSSQIQIANRAYSKIEGIVVDSASLQAIPEVAIWTHHAGTISDAEGNFSLPVGPQDTVHFSHINYHKRVIVWYGQVQGGPHKIFLKQKVTLLNEVKVYPFLSEELFRQKIIQTTPVLSREEEIAMINSKIISYLAQYAPKYPMNAHDNYIDYMKGPQGVVIFSSSPSKGLIKAIKNVIHPNSPSLKRFLNSDSSMRASRNR